MNIIIEEINPHNAKDLNTVDNRFSVVGRLACFIEDDQINYKVVKTPEHEKRYRVDQFDVTTYKDDPDKTILLAYVDGQIAGQIILRRNWNNYAYIEDIAVDLKSRRSGVGKELISWAEQWAREKELAGIMLETQNNNVGACKFYERCGFQLGGFDPYLYKGIDRETDEIALYWYMLFEETPLKRI